MLLTMQPIDLVALGRDTVHVEGEEVNGTVEVSNLKMNRKKELRGTYVRSLSSLVIIMAALSIYKCFLNSRSTFGKVLKDTF